MVSNAPIPFDLVRARGRSIREMPAAERPRERLELRGAAGLTAAELIGLLWGSGGRGRSAVDLAADAMARFDGLTGLARATGQELESVPGVDYPALRMRLESRRPYAGGELNLMRRLALAHRFLARSP